MIWRREPGCIYQWKVRIHDDTKRVILTIPNISYIRVVTLMQSKTSSFIESLLNVGTGYFLALLTQAIVFPWFNINITMQDQYVIALIFTVISIGRTYIFRRLFNYYTGGRNARVI